MSQLSERIRKIRKDLGMRQSTFASLLGVSRSHISSIETGAAKPSDQLLKLITYGCYVNETWLREGKGPPGWEPSPSRESSIPYEFEEQKTSYDRFRRLLRALQSDFRMYLRHIREWKKSDEGSPLNNIDIPPRTKGYIRELQQEVLNDLEELKKYVQQTDDSISPLSNEEESAIKLFRIIDKTLLKDMYLLLATNGERLKEKERTRLKKDIAILRKAAK